VTTAATSLTVLTRILLAFNSYGYFLNSFGKYDEAIKYLDMAIQIIHNPGV
jgi:Tfp pilus assembly protein PilF